MAEPPAAADAETASTRRSLLRRAGGLNARMVGAAPNFVNEGEMAYIDSNELMVVIEVLKARFPNLQVKESIQIASDILAAIYPEGDDTKVGGTD